MDEILDIDDKLQSTKIPKKYRSPPEWPLPEVEYIKTREETAKFLAYAIMLVFFIYVLFPFILIVLEATGYTFERSASFSFADKLLPFVSSLLGTVFGFYFANSRLKYKS
jgi:hypothetical protein